MTDKLNETFHNPIEPGQFGAQAQSRSELVASAFREQERKKQDVSIDARRERLRAAGRKGAAARTHESRVLGGRKAAKTRGFESLSAAGRKGALIRIRARGVKRAAEKYAVPSVNVRSKSVENIEKEQG